MLSLGDCDFDVQVYVGYLCGTLSESTGVGTGGKFKSSIGPLCFLLKEEFSGLTSEGGCCN